jgi:hypothetical protein
MHKNLSDDTVSGADTISPMHSTSYPVCMYEGSAKVPIQGYIWHQGNTASHVVLRTWTHSYDTRKKDIKIACCLIYITWLTESEGLLGGA